MKTAFNNINLPYVNNNVKKIAKQLEPFIYCIYYELAAKKRFAWGWKGSISASLISSVSSLDQGKSILEIRKINYGLHLRGFKAT